MVKKQTKVGLIFSFVLITGILYTIFYIRPWTKEAILFENKDTAVYAESSVNEKKDDSLIPPTKNDSFKEDSEEKKEVPMVMYVHICGAVKKPGVYEVSKETRLNEVVKQAGGLTKEAAKDYMNLAQVVLDGEQYYIPTKTEVKDEHQIKDTSTFTKENTTRNNTSSSSLIDINKASKEELMTLRGVGEAKAEAIIEYREKVGKFNTIEDIKKIRGIKDGLFQKICDCIVVE